MNEPQNPFSLRTAEYIEDDVTFLKLFEPGVLEMLSDQTSPVKVQFIRSSAGGGKTSLLRLFTPRSLQTLHASKKDCPELFDKVRDKGFIDDNGPLVMALHVSISKDYAILMDLGVDEERKARLLFSLLNARIVLAALRAALTLKRLSYPEDLTRITVDPRLETGSVLHGLTFPCTGLELFRWAARLEEDACEMVDGFEPQIGNAIGHSSLVGLKLVKPGAILVGGQSVAPKTLVMFDDVHTLTSSQRQALFDHVVTSRNEVSVWFAERLQALSDDEVLSIGARRGRDYTDDILLESYWTGKAKPFNRFASNIANLRAQASSAQIPSFTTFLAEGLEASVSEHDLAQAYSIVRSRVLQSTQHSILFQEWIQKRDMLEGSAWERLVSWRTLEILISRERSKRQTTLEFALPSTQLEEKDQSGVRGAAEWFITKEFGVPYYFGKDDLAALASFNVEQFLSFSGELFEEIISAKLLRKPLELSASRQERILKKAVGLWWKAIPRDVRYGRSVQTLLTAIAEFCQAGTNNPNASYVPGVTGVGVTMREWEQLLKSDVNNLRDGLSDLKRTLSIAIAHNLLDARPDQSVKNDVWMVLYLNRAICLQFGLPLGHGGHRGRKLRDLRQWLAHGYKPSKELEFD